MNSATCESIYKILLIFATAYILILKHLYIIFETKGDYSMKLQQGYKQPNKYTDILNDNTAIENYKKAKEKQRQQIEEKRLIE